MYGIGFNSHSRGQRRSDDITDMIWSRLAQLSRNFFFFVFVPSGAPLSEHNLRVYRKYSSAGPRITSSCAQSTRYSQVLVERRSLMHVTVIVHIEVSAESWLLLNSVTTTRTFLMQLTRVSYDIRGISPVNVGCSVDVFALMMIASVSTRHIGHPKQVLTRLTPIMGRACCNSNIIVVQLFELTFDIAFTPLRQKEGISHIVFSFLIQAFFNFTMF